MSSDTVDPVRCFVALPLAEPLRRSAADVVAKLRSLPARVSWVRPENMHVTVRFLGDVPSDRLDALRSALDRAAADAAPFTLTYRGLGCFPPRGAPRTLWVGVEGEVAPAHRLAFALATELARLGFPPERRPLSLHLTIGRVRAALRAVDWRSGSSRCGPVDLGTDGVDGLLLFRSDLVDGSPPRYTLLHRAPLHGGAP